MRKRRCGLSGRIYDLEEAVRTAHRWMRERAARDEPFLSRMVTRGEVLYADSGGEPASHREPVAIFTGEVLPQYAGDLEDGTVRELLDELAQEMGRALEQEEIHIAYREPNGIRLQIELKTKHDADKLEGDPDPVPDVRALLQRA
jgi:hypothetical protein